MDRGEIFTTIPGNVSIITRIPTTYFKAILDKSIEIRRPHPPKKGKTTRRTRTVYFRAKDREQAARGAAYIAEVYERQLVRFVEVNPSSLPKTYAYFPTINERLAATLQKQFAS